MSATSTSPTNEERPSFSEITVMPSSINGNATAPTEAQHPQAKDPDIQANPVNIEKGVTAQSLRDDESERVPSEWSELSTAPRRHLGFWEIFSLIINSIIGNGIFTMPGYVLFLTRSKSIALALWAAGGIYTALTILIFAEFGIALPFNGGPMVYLDECYHRPRLLALIVFSIIRIFLGTSESNCRALALNLLVLANPDVSTDQFSNGLISLVSLAVLATICFLIYFMLPFCLFLNAPLAAMKVLLLFILPICGLVAARNEYDVEPFSKTEAGFDSINAMQAMIYVIYSYQGFINANCVAGEIKHIKVNLIRAAAISIFVVTAGYMFMTVALYVVLDFEALTDEDGRSNATAVLIEKAFGSRTGIRVAMALSGFGTLLIQVYTVARVKQAIAWRRIIPFYRFFGRQSAFGTPGGALLLHAIFTAIPLLAFQNSKESVRSFVTGIYSWSHEVIILFLSVGLLRLKRRMNPTVTGFDFCILKHPAALIGMSSLFALTNLFIVISTALSHSYQQIPGWHWPVATAVVLGIALVYWGCLRVLMLSLKSGRTLGSIIGFEPSFQETKSQQGESREFLLWEAEREGVPRLMRYEVTGPLKQLHTVLLAAYRFLFTRKEERYAM